MTGTNLDLSPRIFPFEQKNGENLGHQQMGLLPISDPLPNLYWCLCTVAHKPEQVDPTRA